MRRPQVFAGADDAKIVNDGIIDGIGARSSVPFRPPHETL